MTGPDQSCVGLPLPAGRIPRAQSTETRQLLAGAEAIEPANVRPHHPRGDRPDAFHLEQRLQSEPLRLTEPSLAGHVAQTGEIVNVADAYAMGLHETRALNRRFDAASEYSTRSVLAVPLQDASGRLQTLSSPSSALLQLIFTASHNTAVPNPDFSKPFQTTQALVPPDSTDRLISDKNTSYINSLISLQGSIGQVLPQLSDPAAAKNPATVAPILAAANTAHGSVQ